MDIRTILVPVDFSACSTRVVRSATSLAARLGARLHIVHVGEMPAGVDATTRLHLGERRQTAGELLAHDALPRLEPYAALARAAGVDASVAEAFGPIARTVLTVADRVEADLIVMGTHGRTGLMRLVLGSVAEAVVQGADVPVMLIRNDATLAECGRASCEGCTDDGSTAAEAQVRAEREG